MQSFLESTNERFGPKVGAALAEVLAAMNLPDPKYGTYLGGTEGGALFLNRYGLVLTVGPELEAPEHDLIVRPLREPQKVTDEAGKTLVISLLPGIEGVLKSYADVWLLKGVLGTAGINFWDTDGAKGLKNGGYLRTAVEGFPEGVPLVLDRGGVWTFEEGPRPVDPKSLAASFNPAAVKGIQQKYFARFREALAAAWPESGAPEPAAMKRFLDICAEDIHRGKNATLCNRWAANYKKTGMAFVDKPIEVKEAADAFERQIKWQSFKALLSPKRTQTQAQAQPRV